MRVVRAEAVLGVPVPVAGRAARAGLCATCNRARCIPGKALDLMEEAAGNVRLGVFSLPDALRDLGATLTDLEGQTELAGQRQDYADTVRLRVADVQPPRS